MDKKPDSDKAQKSTEATGESYRDQMKAKLQKRKRIHKSKK